MSTHKEPNKKGIFHFIGCMIVGVFLLLVVTAASITFGAAEMSLKLAWGLYFSLIPTLRNIRLFTPCGFHAPWQISW